MNLKKIILILIAISIIICIVYALNLTNNNKTDNSKLRVVSSNFASYDFLRAIIGENEGIELTFLIGPGKDAHSYDPTAKDLISIQNSNLFIYVGGELEEWSQKVLEAINTEKTKIICIADFIDKKEEKEIDGVEKKEYSHEKGAFDYHIWTSPSNAIKMVYVLEQAIEEIDKENAEIYKRNAEKYIDKIKDVDNKIQEIVDNKVRDRLIFADKMPMQYFIDYYNLKVSAAFEGCSSDTEPSAKTIAYLQNLAKQEKIPVILYIELNPGRVASTIADDVGNGCKAMQIQTLHNVSLDDFRNEETWVSLMTRNLIVLREALL